MHQVVLEFGQEPLLCGQLVCQTVSKGRGHEAEFLMLFANVHDVGAPRVEDLAAVLARVAAQPQVDAFDVGGDDVGHLAGLGAKAAHVVARLGVADYQRLDPSLILLLIHRGQLTGRIGWNRASCRSR